MSKVYRRRNALGEALRALGALKGQALAAMAAVMAIIAITGALAAVEVNLLSVAEQLGKPIRVTVYANVGVEEGDVRREAQQMQDALPGSTVTFISAADAYRAMQEDLGAESNLLEGYSEEQNPLPASIEFQVESRELAEVLTERYAGLYWVDEVQYEKELLDTIDRVSHSFALGSGILGLVLLVIGLFVVWNVVHMAVRAQEQEQHLLRQLGAAERHIIMPYSAMGAVIGLAGAAVAWGLLSVAYWLLIRMLGAQVYSLSLYGAGDMVLLLAALLMPIGTLFGAAAGALAVRGGVGGAKTVALKHGKARRTPARTAVGRHEQVRASKKDKPEAKAENDLGNAAVTDEAPGAEPQIDVKTEEAEAAETKPAAEAKPAAEVKSAAPAAKPAAEVKPAAEAKPAAPAVKPAAEAKPAAEVKPAAPAAKPVVRMQLDAYKVNKTQQGRKR